MTATVRRVPDIRYGEVLGYRPLELDLFLPVVDGPLPVVVYVHGGGWQRGTRREPPPLLDPDFYDQIAAAGLAVAAVDYRLSGEARFPAALEDVRTAVGWVRDNAAAYGLDPGRVFLWGDSAGGHLALLAALTGSALTGAAVRAAVAWFPVTDLLGMPSDLADAGAVPDRGPDSREARFLGAPASAVPDLARQASPVTHARADAPPILLQHGTADDMVPAAQSVRLASALRQAGAAVELELVPGATHFWKGAGDVPAIIARSIEFLRAQALGQADGLAGAELTGDALRGGAHGEPDAARLGDPLGQQDAERGDRRVVGPEDRRGHGHDDLLLLAPVDGQAFAPDLSQGPAHDLGRDQHVIGLAVHGPGQDLLLQASRREGEQDQADRGGVQRQPAPDPVLHRRGLVGGEPLDQRGLGALADGQLDVLAGDHGQVAHERHRDLAQPVPARRERGDLQQPQPDAVAPLLVTLQCPPADQVPGEAERGAHRDAAATAQLGQAELALAGVERRQQRERAVDHRLALRRPLAPDAHVTIVFHWLAS
jgi:acetyl esterase/lipase